MLALHAFILPAAALVGFAPVAAANVSPPVDDRGAPPAVPPDVPTATAGGFPLWAIVTLTAGAAIFIALVALIAFAARRMRRLHAEVPLR